MDFNSISFDSSDIVLNAFSQPVIVSIFVCFEKYKEPFFDLTMRVHNFTPIFLLEIDQPFMRVCRYNILLQDVINFVHNYQTYLLWPLLMFTWLTYLLQ